MLIIDFLYIRCANSQSYIVQSHERLFPQRPARALLLGGILAMRGCDDMSHASWEMGVAEQEWE